MAHFNAERQQGFLNKLSFFETPFSNVYMPKYVELTEIRDIPTEQSQKQKCDIASALDLNMGAPIGNNQQTEINFILMFLINLLADFGNWLSGKNQTSAPKIKMRA